MTGSVHIFAAPAQDFTELATCQTAYVCHWSRFSKVASCIPLSIGQYNNLIIVFVYLNLSQVEFYCACHSAYF